MDDFFQTGAVGFQWSFISLVVVFLHDSVKVWECSVTGVSLPSGKPQLCPYTISPFLPSADLILLILFIIESW